MTQLEGRGARGGDTQKPLRALPSALGLPLCPHGLSSPFSPNQLNPDCHTRPQGAPALSRGRELNRGLPGRSAESCEDARRGLLGAYGVPRAPLGSGRDVPTALPGAKAALPPRSGADSTAPGEFPAPPPTPRRSLNFLPPKPNFDLSKRPPRRARDPAETNRSPRKRWCGPARRYTTRSHGPDVTLATLRSAR